MAFQLTSSAFSNEGTIPANYTCDGSDMSPPLAWSGAPAGTKSYALVVDDPDAPAGTWVHWVVWNIPATVNALAENVAKTAELPDGTRQGISDFKRPGWGGPCPPSGTHRYYFKLYALDALLVVSAPATKRDLETAMKDHILGQATLLGTYTRKNR